MGPTPHVPTLPAQPCGWQPDTPSTYARSRPRTPCTAYIASRQRRLSGAAPVGRCCVKLRRGCATKEEKDTHSGMCVRDETRSVCRRSMSSGTNKCLIRANSRERRSATIIQLHDEQQEMGSRTRRTGRRLGLWHKPVSSQQLDYLLMRTGHQVL